MTQTLSRNFLQVRQLEFKQATKVLQRKRLRLGPALLAYEGGFLSIESGEVTVVMHAEGEWHGRATFSQQVLQALAIVPPEQYPIPISYADGHLLIGNMTISCQWQLQSAAFLENLTNPSLIDLLALDRSAPRAGMKVSELGKLISNAKAKAERRICDAAAKLQELEVTEAEIRALVERRIEMRFRRGGEGS